MSKNKLIVLWALQANAPQKDLEQYLKPGSTIEYKYPEILRAQALRVKGFGETFDYATAAQQQDGTILFWEVMPYGQRLVAVNSVRLLRGIE